MIKTLNFNVFGTKRDVAPKKRPDRFPPIGDHIRITPTFEPTPRHAVIEVLKNLRSGIDF